MVIEYVEIMMKWSGDTSKKKYVLILDLWARNASDKFLKDKKAV